MTKIFTDESGQEYEQYHNQLLSEFIVIRPVKAEPKWEVKFRPSIKGNHGDKRIMKYYAYIALDGNTIVHPYNRLEDITSC